MKVDPTTGQAQPTQVLQPAAVLAPMVGTAATAAGLPPGIPPGAVAVAVQQAPAPPQAAVYSTEAAAAAGAGAGAGGDTGGAGAVAGGAGQQQGVVPTLPQAFEKKLRRLEKNRESARGAYICVCVLSWQCVLPCPRR